MNLLVPGVLPFLAAAGVEHDEGGSAFPQVLQQDYTRGQALGLRRDQPRSSFFASSSISSSSSSIAIS